uniref:Uncharacterized protein n=1 Tax=Rhinolophus ferrumequinum TaxID=59479 RepID=A0A671E6N0_RHIFE
MGTQGCRVKSYDYLLKSLLVGDSDVSKSEILENLQHRTAERRFTYLDIFNGPAGKPPCRQVVNPPQLW